MSTRDRSILAALVLVVVAVGGYFLLVQPKHHQASRLQAQIASAQSGLSQAEEQVQQGLAAEAKYRTYADQLNALQAAVPADAQIPALINQLQAAADRTHTGFQTVSLGSTASTTSSTATTTPGASSTFPSQSFSLNFTGTYFSVANLLGTLAGYVRADNKKFKATGRLLTISTVSFVAGKGGFPNVAASVTALDYAIPSALGPTASTATGTPAADVTP